ncbi:MAG TPA: histidinol-phosphate transaminase [Clostridia bacterium]|nr:histidinol-phosphate transaminase [Clostridia bacterium]
MIDDLISKRALEIESYKVEPKLQGIALDKNEIPWSLNERVKEALIGRIRTMEFNRYPDSNCTELKTAVSDYTGVDTGRIAIGNGSDELISVILQAFIDPGDTIAVYSPTFSMYKIYGTICGARIWEYDLDSNFELEPDGFIAGLKAEKPKLVILCNPNNPTGGCLELEEIERILEAAPGIVIVDEAYYEFSGVTAVGLLDRYDNLIVLRTLSKALGIAGLRLGYMLACPAAVGYIDRVRAPFNVNAFTQTAAIEVLANADIMAERVEIIKGERDKLAERLSTLKGLQCFESRSNFILMRTVRAGEIFAGLREAGVHVRSYSDPVLKDCLRVTIGSPEENEKFYEAVKEVLYEGA